MSLHPHHACTERVRTSFEREVMYENSGYRVGHHYLRRRIKAPDIRNIAVVPCE
jgi:hypothetical protein